MRRDNKTKEYLGRTFQAEGIAGIITETGRHLAYWRNSKEAGG